MKILTFIFLLPVTLFYSPSYAKGHGGGHGGHGHGGHGGGTHSSEQNGEARHSAGRTASRSKSSAARTLPPINQINGFKNGRGNNVITPRYTVAGNTTPGYNPNEHWNSYPYYFYGSYGYAPYYDPYFSMWSFGANFMYTPHYSSPATNEYNNDENNNKEPMQGFVVFEHDTISGQITISKNAISLETKDTARGYDYKFKKKQQGLQYVTVYDNDDTTNQLNLVRLKNNKELLREIHTGKLNIYDGKYGFIYRPEDIDVSTIVVVYNGQQDALHSSSAGKTKHWLTDYVNKAYNLELKPKDFTWKELLIYIDKLD
jgi:hypothetical protein